MTREDYIDTITGEELTKIYSRGDIKYYDNQHGQLHRTDGPAIEYADGDKFWYQNGKLHRTDGPAIERADGTKFWYQNGKLHRTDGPAIEWTNGTKEWHLYGKRLFSEEEFMQALKDDNLSYVMDLHSMIHPDVQKSSRDKLPKQKWSLKQALEDLGIDN